MEKKSDPHCMDPAAFTGREAGKPEVEPLSARRINRMNCEPDRRYIRRRIGCVPYDCRRTVMRESR
jgi:hypothetical protein